jgi:hypothetical protein
MARLSPGLAVACATTLVAAALVPSAPGPARKVEYGRDVRPILSDKCFKCHGPDAAVAATNGLRLDLREDMVKDRGGYAVVAPGEPGKSRLLERVAATDFMRMPPQDSGKPALTPEELETLRLWIEQGAEVTPHWAWVPPQPPPVPKGDGGGWARNEVDRFVLASLAEHGLEPEPEADRPTLARRAALALTGLPPSLQDLDRFVKDKRPDAYQRYVDRLLASPRYGEHQARFWLDAVRYGDTHGLHLDNERLVHPYRDWVVRAFNEDLPFDQFTLWQLAGDLMPNPSLDMRIATGYVRMNPTTNEGGAIEAEFVARNTFDRVETTATVFLGLTASCARCHSHKYDPLSHDDYFRLFAFFNSTKDKPLDGNLLLPEPVLPAPTPTQAKEMDRLRATMARLVARADATAVDRWLATARVEPPAVGVWEASQAFTAESFDAAFATEFGPEPEGKEVETTWRTITVEPGKLAANIAGKENAAVFVRTTLTAAKPRTVVLALGSDDGVRVWLNGKKVHENKVLRGAVDANDSVTLELNQGENALLVQIVNSGGPDGLIVRFGDRVTERIEATTKALADGATPAERQEAAALFLEAGPETSAAKEYRAASAAAAELDKAIPRTLVAEEGDPMPAYVLKRGDYDKPLHQVERGVPSFLGSLPDGAPVNRLGLAQWLVSNQNPLTARVFVNRLWQQHFGTGIVKTSEDFGNQGEWPMDKALLDWLATRFVASGWRVKAMHRLVVTSAAFRQRAPTSPEKRATDPENRLASRGPRFRLDAEVIRDQALAVSGLLVERPGGKGFKPYQPEGLWEAIAFTESDTSKYVPDTGPGIYRRSLYLFWKRTSPHPVMLTFDAPMREACTVRRSRTNTPTQALVTLNEPMFLEAARVMGEAAAAGKGSDHQKVERLFRTALCRPPTDAEAKVLTAALARHRKTYSDPAEAEKLLKVGQAPRRTDVPAGEAAAWMLVCSTVMNLDEFLSQP